MTHSWAKETLVLCGRAANEMSFILVQAVVVFLQMGTCINEGGSGTFNAGVEGWPVRFSCPLSFAILAMGNALLSRRHTSSHLVQVGPWLLARNHASIAFCSFVSRSPPFLSLQTIFTCRGHIPALVVHISSP